MVPACRRERVQSFLSHQKSIATTQKWPLGRLQHTKTQVSHSSGRSWRITQHCEFRAYLGDHFFRFLENVLLTKRDCRYNANNVAAYTILNVTIIQGRGTAALLLGSVSADNDSSVWNCTSPGSVLSRDATGSFFSMTFTQCEIGSYVIGGASTTRLDRKCLTCPFGANCTGSSESSNGLLALPDFFGAVNGSQHANFFVCPAGNCCNKKSGRSGCPLGYCEGNRQGVLCGSCLPGMGLRFFKPGCLPDDECDDLRWFAPALVAVAICFSLFLIITTGNPSSATLGTPMFFYQVVSLVKTSPWTHTAPVVVFVMQSAANQAPSESSPLTLDWNGVCLFPSMSQAKKLGASLLFRSFSLDYIGGWKLFDMF